MRFKTPSEERVFSVALSAYEEEFGAENIIIVIPKSWVNSIDWRSVPPHEY